MMKRILTLLFASFIAFAFSTTVFGAEGRVTYSGNAGSFVFEPVSDYSPTDLFSNFKSVMPGDTLKQKITVKNEADNNVKVKIYIRSLGAHEDSVDFLSQLDLKISKSEENEMAYMFDAAANEAAQLTDWVCLGTLYSGGEVNLDVTLSVPVELSSEYQSKIGYLDWEFMIEEFPIEPGDPKPPQTDDNFDIKLWAMLMAGSLVMIIILFLWRKKNNKNKENAVKP